VETRYNFGCYKSPYDERDYLLRTFLTRPKLPEQYSLRDKMTPIRSQGKEGACVGFAMATGVKEYQEQIDSGFFISLSPRFVYELAKQISGHKEGTTLKAACEVVHEFGVCEEISWPYIANDVGQPQQAYMANAEQFKIKSYARITNINELKEAIYDPKVGASLIGVKVYNGMISGGAKETGIVPDPSCWEVLRVLGGHALCACAYQDKSPYFKNDGHILCKNSWGDKYYDDGYIYLSYKYIKSNILDAFACIDIREHQKFDIIKVADIRGERGAWT